MAVLPANPLQHSMGAGKVLRVGAVHEGGNAVEGWGVRGWGETLVGYLNRTLGESLEPPVGVELVYYAYDDLIEEVSASIVPLEYISHLTGRQSLQIPASHPPVPLLHGSCLASLPCRLLSSLRQGRSPGQVAACRLEDMCVRSQNVSRRRNTVIHPPIPRTRTTYGGEGKGEARKGHAGGEVLDPV
jgi:hypothetical protein